MMFTLEETRSLHYEILAAGEEFLGVRAVAADGKELARIPDVSDRKAKLENVVRLYNENGLPLECFEEITEKLIGVLM